MADGPTCAELAHQIKTLERERAELLHKIHQLSDTEKKYRTFFANSLDGMFITKPDGTILEANPAVCSMLGYTPEELIRLGREAVVDRNDPRLDPALHQRATKGFFAGELNLKRKDGTIVPVEITSVVFATEENEKRTGIIVRDATERKAAQRELEKQRNMLQSMERITRVGGWEYDVVNQTASWTDGVYAIHGFSKQEYSPADPGQNIELYHPEDRKIIAAAFWGAVENGEPYDLELRLNSENGAVRWVHTMAQAERDGGRVVRVYGNIMDITEQKQVEEALRESEAFNRAVMDHLPMGLAVNSVEPDVHFVYMNDKFPKFYRTTREDLLDPNAFWEVVYEDPVFREQIRSRVIADCASGDPERMYWENIPIAREGKETCYVCAGNTPVPGKSLMISTVWDVTDRVKMELDLKKSEEQYRTLFESIDEGFCVLEVLFDAEARPVDYRFLEVNPAFEKQTGLSGAKGRSMRSLVPEHESHWFETYGRIALTGIAERFQNEARALDRWFDVYAFRIDHPEKRHVAVLFNDITGRMKAEQEREKLQEQLLRAQKLESVGRLAGGVAHDYNNMLSVILGYTELVLEKVASDSDLQADLKEVLAAARRSADITRQLLAFARKQTIDPQVVDLNELVESMLRMLRRLIGEDIDLVWRPGKQLWAIKIDPVQVDQILANLCVNARDAIAGVGKVAIETRNVMCDEAWCRSHVDGRPGEFVLLTVADDGCGMDKEMLDQVFEPFFTTKEVSEGTGLGLPTVYGIVQQNEGFINVASDPGQGTIFEIYLPRHAADQKEVNLERKVQAPEGRGEMVLLVEDEPAIMKMTRVLLQKLGYQVLAAGSPSQALKLAASHAGGIDLLLTDVVMPEMNGRDLADQLHVLYPDLKTLFMSGYTASVIAHRGVLEEGTNFIQKPFSINDLGIKVRTVLDGG